MFNSGVAVPVGHPASKSTPLVAEEYANDGKHHLLLCASGSVATIKLPHIIQALSHHRNLSIRVLLTKSAERFLEGQSREQPPLKTLNLFTNIDGVYTDEDEWNRPWSRGGGILHIELRRWADLMVIAPLSANSLAKMVSGICDNLMLSVVRAWDTTGEFQLGQGRKRIIVAPVKSQTLLLTSRPPDLFADHIVNEYRNVETPSY
jgi:phosphopantothenoylcysteine decarboxylase